MTEQDNGRQSMLDDTLEGTSLGLTRLKATVKDIVDSAESETSSTQETELLRNVLLKYRAEMKTVYENGRKARAAVDVMAKNAKWKDEFEQIVTDVEPEDEAQRSVMHRAPCCA